MYVIFFFNDTATTEIYTLSLHDALPISLFPVFESPHERCPRRSGLHEERKVRAGEHELHAHGDVPLEELDRKSTRLNSSHANISYAVFCLKKKKTYLQSPWLSTCCVVTT